MPGIKVNSAKAWVLASRPKTLPLAAIPIFIAISTVFLDGYRISWIPAVLCLLFALIMQIEANLVNDYFDCVKGVDGKDRLGPERACTQGWITLPAMRRAITLTAMLAAAVGLPLIRWGGMEMIGIGAACIVFCFLYTTVFSRIAMGDVLVLLFFGVIPACITYYLQTQIINTDIFLLSLSCGLLSDCLLVVNNYRDRETDKKAGKLTLVTLIGPEATEWLYIALGAAAVLLTFFTLKWLIMIPVVWFFLIHVPAWKLMKRLNNGRELNVLLEMTARNITAFGLMTSFLIVIYAFLMK